MTDGRTTGGVVIRELRRLRVGDSPPLSWAAFAAIIVFCLVMLYLPWEAWSGGFGDRDVYIKRFGDFRPEPPRTFIGGALSFVTNEVLWDKGVRWCTSKLHLSAEFVFGAISFLCLFVFSKYLVSRHGIASLLFLVNPLVVVFAFSQLRMALAVSLLLLALFWRGHWLLAALLISIACCIHTAAILFLFMFFAAKLLLDMLSAVKMNGLLLWLGLVAIGIAVVLVIGPFRAGILSKVGDRRAEYVMATQGIKFSLFWFALLFTTAAQTKKYLQAEKNAVAVVFLSVFTFAAFLNVSNGRFLAAAYPMIISSMFALGTRSKAPILIAYGLYTAVHWCYWMHWV